MAIRSVQSIAVASAAWLWGLQMAFLSPALALLLTELFGASVSQISVVLMLYNAACLVAVYWGSKSADVRGSYKSLMIAGGVMTVALSLALAFAQSIAVGVAALVLLGAPAALGVPLLFGYVRHAGASKSEVVRVRALFSAAWFVGPLAATLVITGPGPRVLVLLIGVVGALNVLATSFFRPRSGVVADAIDDEAVVTPAVTGSHATLILVLLVVVFAGLQATNTASTSIVTLFSQDTLGLSPVWGGIALGVAAGIEIPALLGLSRLLRRQRDELLLLGLSCVVGVGYYLGMALTSGAAGLVGLQVLNAAFYAVVAGVGLTVFQDLVEGPGRASGMLANSMRIGAILSGPLVALGSSSAWGLRSVFVGCGIVTLLAFILIQVLRRVRRHVIV